MNARGIEDKRKRLEELLEKGFLIVGSKEYQEAHQLAAELGATLRMGAPEVVRDLPKPLDVGEPVSFAEMSVKE